MMTQQEKWDFINRLDHELLIGGVMLSEWATFLIRDSDVAFCSGANLAAILTAQAAIETHFRFEYFDTTRRRNSFFNLIETSSIPGELKIRLHTLRKYRNQWVHVNDPHSDEELLTKPSDYEVELEEMAKFALRVLRETIYLDQFV